jgi:hypothetical protein
MDQIMDEPFQFEDFPFRKLKIEIPRRDLFHSLLKEVTGSASAVNHKPTFRMADLGELPVDAVERLVPALFPGCEFQSDDAFVFGKAPRHMEFKKLFPKDSMAHVMFQFFNKKRSLREISWSLRKRYSMEPEQSLLFVRGLFLFLVEEGFAYPADGIPGDE